MQPPAFEAVLECVDARREVLDLIGEARPHAADESARLGVVLDERRDRAIGAGERLVGFQLAAAPIGEAKGARGAARLGEVAPVITGIPSTLWITAKTASDLRFTGAAFANASANEVLALTLTLPTSSQLTFDANANEGLAATAGGDVTIDTALSTARTTSSSVMVCGPPRS